MNDIQKKLDQAFAVLARVPVSGDGVDLMAAGRTLLREAFKLAGDKSALWEAHKLAEKAEKKEETDG